VRSAVVVAGLAGLAGLAACDRSGGRTAPRSDAPPTAAPSARPVAARPAAPSPPPADPLTVTAQIGLRSRMFHHGDTLENLLWASLMLDRTQVPELAHLLEDEVWSVDSPMAGDPSPDDDGPRDDGLPPRYRLLEDRLVRATRTLAATAARGDREAMAGAFAGVAEACVHCHALYLPADRGAPPR
jgi:hypothetical protein